MEEYNIKTESQILIASEVFKIIVVPEQTTPTLVHFKAFLVYQAVGRPAHRVLAVSTPRDSVPLALQSLLMVLGRLLQEDQASTSTNSGMIPPGSERHVRIGDGVDPK